MSLSRLKTYPRLIPALLAALLAGTGPAVQAAAPTLEDKIEILQRELEALKQQVAKN